MANTFQFVGKISRRKDNAFVEKKFNSGWMINELNLTMTCGDNVQFLRASGGMWDEAHTDKNSVITYQHNESGKDTPITVKWEDRMNPEIIDTIANYRTYTVDTETKKDRDAIEASGDAAAIEVSNKKHKSFITAIDFVRWLDKVTSNAKTKDWVWRVTGEVEYSYSKGMWYRNFVPRRVYHVDPATEPQCVGTIKTFFSEGCIDDTGDKDVIFNVFTQYYDQPCKKNCFTPMSLVIAKDHPKAKGLIRQYGKAEDDAVREISVNVVYINGAQKVEISTEHLTDAQREMIEDGLITLDDIRKDMGGSVYGDKKIETRITDLARGSTTGSKETVFMVSDLTKLPIKDEPKAKVDETVDLFADNEDTDI